MVLSCRHTSRYPLLVGTQPPASLCQLHVGCARNDSTASWGAHMRVLCATEMPGYCCAASDSADVQVSGRSEPAFHQVSPHPDLRVYVMAPTFLLSPLQSASHNSTWMTLCLLPQKQLGSLQGRPAWQVSAVFLLCSCAGQPDRAELGCHHGLAVCRCPAVWHYHGLLPTHLRVF